MGSPVSPPIQHGGLLVCLSTLMALTLSNMNMLTYAPLIFVAMDQLWMKKKKYNVWEDQYNPEEKEI